ncbi:MAG: metallophosphoesterase [Chitinophagaceae bacterium]|nr:metallophosphoesterase [Chitinophagaceae bacterium]
MNTSVKKRERYPTTHRRNILGSHVKEVQREYELTEDRSWWMELRFNFHVIFKWPIGIFYYFKYVFSGKRDFPVYKQPLGGIFPVLSETCSIGLLSDWASFTSESILAGDELKKKKCDITIHMGDIYYVGSRKDVLLNFGEKGAWPWGTKGSFAIPGNHEYFSTAEGFFEELLPRMGINEGEKKWVQESGFFCLENKYWRIIGLDTGYHSVKDTFIKLTLGQDARLDDVMIEWLKSKVQPFAPNDNRGIILLTHHQPKSAFEGFYDRIVQQLIPVFGDKRSFIWFWGHEHRLAFYGVDAQKDVLKAFGRCIGHGGMPVELGNQVELDEPEDDRATQQSLIFYDQRVNSNHRELKSLANEMVGFNGYATIDLNHEQAIIRHYDVEHELPLVTENWQVNMNSGELTGAIEIHASGLTFYKNADPSDAVSIRNLL